jgi:hypothetical protein
VLPPGTHHVALLPTPGTADPSAATGPCCQSCAPLVTAPLLVLPSDAAMELQALWQQAASAGGTIADRLIYDKEEGVQGQQVAVLSAAWRLQMSGLLADMGYILAVPAAQHPSFTQDGGTGGGALNNGTGPEQPQKGSGGCAATRLMTAGHSTATAAVAGHLLQHLAERGLWALAGAVVVAAGVPDTRACDQALMPSTGGPPHGGDTGHGQAGLGAAGAVAWPTTAAAATGSCQTHAASATTSSWLAGDAFAETLGTCYALFTANHMQLSGALVLSALCASGLLFAAWCATGCYPRAYCMQ